MPERHPGYVRNGYCLREAFMDTRILVKVST